jgi:6-phosphogluconolactonase
MSPPDVALQQGDDEPAGIPLWARARRGRSVRNIGDPRRHGMYQLVVAPTAEDAASDAARRIAVAIDQARSERGVAHIALAGGTTPRRVYEILGPLLADWASVHLWFGDERAVAADDPDSNFRLVSESLLAVADIPEEHVHRIVGEWPPEEAAETYAAELVRLVPLSDTGIPVLDVAFLGMGEDGHTASLFPGDPLLGVSRRFVRAVRAPKPPPDRVTLTIDVLYAARQAIVLATGAGKKDAVSAVLRGPDASVPASLLPIRTTTLIVDTAAAPDD